MPDVIYLRSKTFDASAGAFVDDNGIKTSIATAATIQTYVTFNGTSTLGKAVTGTHDSFASWPTVKNSSATASYVNASTIVFTGTYGGVVTTRTATLTSADGGATVLADGPLDHGSITKIVVAAQVDTAGAFEFGWTGVAPKKGYAWAMVAREAGTYHVEHRDGGVDYIALPAHGEHFAFVSRIFGDVTVDATVYEIDKA